MAIKDSDGDYARILRRLIDDPDYCRMHPSARFVWLTLLIAPEFKLLGIATADIDSISRRTGLTAALCRKALEILKEADVIRMDGAWCWLRNHLRFQENSESWRKSEATMTGLSRRLNNLPVGLSFLPEFIELYATLGFNFDLSPRLKAQIRRGQGRGPHGGIENPEPETPETPEPETHYIPQETLAVVATVPAAPPRATNTAAVAQPDHFTLLAQRFVASFNATLGKHKAVTPEITARIRARLRSSYKPWHIVALPIMVDAQGLSPEMRKSVDPLTMLRDGKHPRTSNGQTYGATDWLERALGRIDETSLTEHHAEVARQFGVLENLMALGASIIRESA